MNFTLFFSVVLFFLAGLAWIASIIFTWYNHHFAKNAKVGVGIVTGRAGKKVLVKFRDGKRTVIAPAGAFDATPISVGQKVPFKFLPMGSSPMRWDVRIIGKAGYGKNRVKRFSLIIAAAGCVLAAIAVCFLLI